MAGVKNLDVYRELKQENERMRKALDSIDTFNCRIPLHTEDLMVCSLSDQISGQVKRGLKL